MKPQYVDGNVRAHCPDCGGAVTTFEDRDARNEFGTLIVEREHFYERAAYSRVLYRLLRCAGCHRGGLAQVHDRGAVVQGALEEFWPVSIDQADIPASVPDGILREFREAERCAAFHAWRAASALLRSTLEKALGANGYVDGTLYNKIDEAAADGIITDARRGRAHEDIRVLGNDVLHEDWREVSEAEVDAAHRYSQRILEDFYDDRPTVETALAAKGRVQRDPQAP